MILLHGDCLELMAKIESNSVDMVLADLPYGTTACKWDSVIPFEPLWAELNRVAKLAASVVLFASQPFTSALVSSRPKLFKCSWVWVKTNCSGFANAKKQPLRSYEDILVFYRKQPTYNPQGVIRLESPKVRTKDTGAFMGKTGFRNGYAQEFTNYPKNVLSIPSESKTVHPTQKPVALLEYLIKTYTNEGDTVLDPTMGSGSCGVACKNLNRKFIGIEKDEKYFQIAQRRMGE